MLLECTLNYVFMVLNIGLSLVCALASFLEKKM